MSDLQTVEEADALGAEIARCAALAQQIRKDIAVLTEALAPAFRDAADDTAAASEDIEAALIKISAQLSVLDAMAATLGYEREGGDRQHSTLHRGAL